jgi:hypothetical protein
VYTFIGHGAYGRVLDAALDSAQTQRESTFMEACAIMGSMGGEFEHWKSTCKCSPAETFIHESSAEAIDVPAGEHVISANSLDCTLIDFKPSAKLPEGQDIPEGQDLRECLSG